MRMDLSYEYGRRMSPGSKILALIAIAVSGVLLAFDGYEKPDFDAKEAETQEIQEFSTD